MELPDFARLFEDGREVASADFGRVVLRPHAAGLLLLTTGRVVACDPLAAPDTEPFTTPLPPGAYSVTLGVASFADGDQRVAGALLSAGAGPVARWEMAVLPGEDPAALGEGEIYGYGDDSGTGCFMDAAAAELLAAAMEADERVSDTLIEEMEKAYVETWSWANVGLDPETGLNLVTFSTGLGEGLYATYVGYDGDGRPVALATDFGLFEHEELS